MFEWLKKRDNDIIEELSKRIIELTNTIRQDKKIVCPKVIDTISYNSVMKILSDNGIKNVELSDNYFDLTSVDEAKKYSEETKVQYEKYVSEEHDCDNFSFALLGYWSESLKSFAFGTARSMTHRYNIMIDDKKELWICEPQTNQWFKYQEIIKTNQLYITISVLM